MVTTVESEKHAGKGSTSPQNSTKHPEYEPQPVVAATTIGAGAVTIEYDTLLTQNAEMVSSSAPKPATATMSATWPGWPGDSVFRLIVPLLKVGSIIGRKGDIIKKMCEETGARIRVLEAPIGTADRIVLISGKEEPEVPVSPAMDAAIRIFKCVSGLAEGDSNPKGSGAAGIAFCSIRLLVAFAQAINLIGKQGSLIKSIQETTGASLRVLSEDEAPFYVAADERIVELQGEAFKVLKAVEAVVGHLRKFLVARSVIPLFEKNYNAIISRDHQMETWSDKSLLHSTSQAGIDTDYRPLSKREALFLEREIPLDSQIPPSRISLYGQDHGVSSIRSSVLNHASGPIVNQITKTIQVPISYAEEIIGIGGNNIAYIRRTSGAIITVQESRGLPDEITVEIMGTLSQVQTAQQLIQDFINNHKESVTSSYGKYSHLDDDMPYSSSYGRYGVGRYTSYRL